MAFDHVLSSLLAAGEARVVAEGVALAHHAVSLSPREEDARRRLLEAAGGAGLVGVAPDALAASAGQDPKLFERVSRVLVAERLLDRVGEGLLVRREDLERLQADVRKRWPAGSRLDVGAFKEMTGLTRKFVIPLLEYLDRERVTRRSGTDRTVI